MINKYIFDTTAPDVCFNGKMSVADIMETVQYAVMMHTEVMDVGFKKMLETYNGKWVIAKLRLEFENAISNGDALHIETWPHKPSLLKFGRSFKITDSEGIAYVNGYSDWCIIDADSFEIKRSRDIAFPEMEYITEKTISGKYSNIGFDGGQFVYDKTVRVSDLDINGHVNNVNYIRMAMDCFSSSELKNFDIKSFDMHFTAQCFEGDKISMYRAYKDGFIIINAKKEDTEVFRAIIKGDVLN